jgi:glycine cleavage system regulatory protein
MWCAIINIYEDNNHIETKVKDSRSEFKDEQRENLVLTVNAKERSSPNVINEVTTVFKNKKIESKQQASGSISSR